MTNITLTLDHHDFGAAIIGFARGSHLRQHVWSSIVFPAIRQMDDEFLDYLWWILRRDHFADYFDADGEGISCGCDDYLHCLAALHRVNRFRVRFVARDTEDQSVHEVIAYRYNNNFHPVFSKEGEQTVFGFNSYIPDEYIECSEWIGENALNPYVETSKQYLWKDISVYDI